MNALSLIGTTPLNGGQFPVGGNKGLPKELLTSIAEVLSRLGAIGYQLELGSMALEVSL